MFQHLSAYCASVVENVYAFLYHFLLSYKSYVVINIFILGLNLILLRSVNYYMSKKKAKHQDSMMIDKAKFVRKSNTRPVRHQRSNTSACKVPSINFERQQAQCAANKNPRNAEVISRTSKNTGKAALGCQKFVTPPTQLPSAHSAKRQAIGDKCDETLDEITWACDESHSSLANMENVKYRNTRVQTPSCEDLRKSTSSHICRRMGKSTDVRDDQLREDEGHATVREEGKQKKDKIRQDGKKRQKDEDPQSKPKNCSQKKKTGKTKQKHKKVSRGVNTLKQSPSAQQNDLDSGEPDMTVVDLRPSANQDVAAHIEEKQPYLGEVRTRKIRRKQHLSPRAMETVKNSSGDSKNSLEESDMEMAGSDHQYHGNRSESSLVCKRDSWIWFSPDIRPSVEDFAARQRKFRSRDPRVAELAFEISRQEEMNRDIERAAESLIDSSSPSTCKLHDGTLRVVCAPISQKDRCGAMKNRACRKSRMAPYTVPDIKKLPMSPVLVSNLATGDHAKQNGHGYSDRVYAGKAPPLDVLKIPPTASPEKLTEKAKESIAPTSKRRKTRQKNFNQKSKNRNHGVICAESRNMSSSSEQLKHNVGDQIPFMGGSLAHAINWYNSPAANVIRQLYTPSRYSPLYDNTTLACSTQCSLCSLVSSSLEHAKAVGNQDKNRALKMEDESHPRDSCLVQNGQVSSPCEIKRSPGETNVHLGRYVQGEKVTSPKRKQYYREVPESSVLSKEEVENCVESPCNVQDRYRDRLSPKWRSSKSSPRKRRFSDRVVSYSNRLTPESRMENYKYARRSPQLTFSTGESESDSVYKDKSGGPDASYRQCVISKEVNTTVQRLLFDTEKSSSSHSPSSRSKIQFQDVNTDEDCTQGAKREIKSIPNAAHLRESCTKINISRDSPPNLQAGTQGSNQESDSDKHSCGFREEQLPEAVNAPKSLISSESQTSCTCQRAAHKFTNIYARDYYLGKRVTLKKQLEATSSAHACKWKKLDITWCRNAPHRSHSSQNKSRLLASRRDCVSSTRETTKRKPGLKVMTYSSRHTQRFHTSVGCQVPQTNSITSTDNLSKENLAILVKDEREINRNACKCPQMNTNRTQHAQDYKKYNRTNVGFAETCDKKSSFRKSCSQIENSMLPENLAMSPTKKSHNTSRSVASAHRCKTEEGVQAETSTLLATASTNNSSSNLSYGSDKSQCSEKPNLFARTAQFYFVTRAKLSPENNGYQRDRSGCFKLAKDTHVDMFKNSQISCPPLKSGIPLEANISVESSELKNGTGHTYKEIPSKECTTKPGMRECFTTTSMGNCRARLTVDRPMCSSLQGTNSLAQNKMYPGETANTNSQVSDAAYYCNENPDVLTRLRHSFPIQKDNRHKGGVLVREEGCAAKSEVLPSFESNTVDVDQCNFVAPVTASAVKQSSNPDSGYDECLSEKANGDSSLQMSLATAADSSKTGSSPQWYKLQTSNLEQRHVKSWSISPLSDGSCNSDHAHRSHISNDCDSEQDTLPSLSDDTFQTSSNFDPIIHRSPETSRRAQNARSVSFTNDMARRDIYQHSSFNNLIGCNAGGESRRGLKKAARRTKTDCNWTSHHNIQNETDNAVSKQRLLNDTSQLYSKESSWNATTGMVDCHTGMTPVSKQASEGYSDNTELRNTGNTVPDYSTAQMLNIFHFQAKSSEAHILENDSAWTLTQVNGNPTCSGVIKRTPEIQGTEIAKVLYKSAYNPNSMESIESRPSYLTQSEKGIDSVWSIAEQSEKRPVKYLRTFSSQDSNETYETSRSNTPLTVNMILDWPSLDEYKPKETKLGLLRKELEEVDQLDSASGPTENCNVKATLSSTACPSEAVGDEPPQSITLPPTSSDEEDAEGGESSQTTHVHTSDHETHENTTNNYWTRKGTGRPFTDNGKCEPQWSCKTDAIHSTLTTKQHLNNYKQHADKSSSSQAKNKVFISDRSIEFRDILKRF